MSRLRGREQINIQEKQREGEGRSTNPELQIQKETKIRSIPAALARSRRRSTGEAELGSAAAGREGEISAARSGDWGTDGGESKRKERDFGLVFDWLA